MAENEEIHVPELDNIEELVCQPSIDVAIEKMRNGVRMYLRDGAWDSIFELHRVKNLNGEEKEFVVEFDNKDGYPISDFDSLHFWIECVGEFVGKRNLTLSPDEALDLLKKGKRIITPNRMYFVGTIDAPVDSVKGVKYVFVDYRPNADPGGIFLEKELDNFVFKADRRYGVDPD